MKTTEEIRGEIIERITAIGGERAELAGQADVHTLATLQGQQLALMSMLVWILTP